LLSQDVIGSYKIGSKTITGMIGAAGNDSDAFGSVIVITIHPRLDQRIQIAHDPFVVPGVSIIQLSAEIVPNRSSV